MTLLITEIFNIHYFVYSQEYLRYNTLNENVAGCLLCYIQDFIRKKSGCTHAILIRTVRDVGFHGLKNIPNNMRNVKCSPESDCNLMEINAKYICNANESFVQLFRTHLFELLINESKYA